MDKPDQTALDAVRALGAAAGGECPPCLDTPCLPQPCGYHCKYSHTDDSTMWAVNCPACRKRREARDQLAAVAVNSIDAAVAALEAVLDSKTALRIACPTCTITLLEKDERLHEEDCPAWLAQQALAAIRKAALEALAGGEA